MVDGSTLIMIDVNMDLAMEDYREALNRSNNVSARMHDDVVSLEELLMKLKMNRPVKGVSWQRLEEAINKVIDEAKKDENDYKDRIESIVNGTY